MPIMVNCVVEDVEEYEGKKGYGANILVSKLIDGKRKLLKFNISDQYMAVELSRKLQKECVLTLELTQNDFGMRISRVIEVA